MKQAIWILGALVAYFSAGCSKPPATQNFALFKDDLAFLKQHTEVVVLSDETGARQVAVSPRLQGRVLTSTAEGAEGLSFGWINRSLIASGENNLHMNAFGGEDRFWLGPEGGQFSLFFKQGDPFDLDHWFTPPALNWESFETVRKEACLVQFKKSMKLTNYAGFTFDVEVDRTVRLAGKEELGALGIQVPDDVQMVAFTSDNVIRNTGAWAWTKDTGLISIWILGMFNPSDRTTIVIPFTPGSETELGPIVNDRYFGKVPPDRLKIEEKGVLFFKGDGKYRSKIGLSPARVRAFAGSWDAENGVLTLIHLTLPAEPAEYVNSMWEIQEHPYEGDVVNSYNDGPAAPGAAPLGPFYELESSSPAAAIAPGQSLRHMHTTVHFRGPREALDRLARIVLGAGLEEIEQSLTP